MQNSPNIVAKKQIEHKVWQEEVPTSDAYKMLIYRLRKAVDGDHSEQYIQTIRGQGVQLIDPALINPTFIDQTKVDDEQP